MTEHPHPDDELVSAYLDGEATADEVARVESEPALAARVAELERVRARLAAPDPPAGALDSHVSAALAAFDDPDRDAGAPVATLAGHRARRLYDRIPLGAVAAAVVVLALIGALTQIDFGSEDDVATSADSTTGELETAGGGDGSDASDSDRAVPGADIYADDSAGAGASPGEPVFPDTDALADHVAGETAARTENQALSTTTAAGTGDEAAPAAPDASEGDPCDVVSLVDADPEAVVLVLPAVVDGQDVTALVTDTDGRHRLRVVDDATCGIIDDRVL